MSNELLSQAMFLIFSETLFTKQQNIMTHVIYYFICLVHLSSFTYVFFPLTGHFNYLKNSKLDENNLELK